MSLVGNAYPGEQQQLVDDWLHKWGMFIGFLSDTIISYQPLYSPPVPTDTDEISYFGHRAWFLDHQEAFLPLWADYARCNCGIPMSKLSINQLIGFSILENKYSDNPFLFVYEPPNLSHLIQQLEMQSGIEIWEPSSCVALDMSLLMLGLAIHMEQFSYWIKGKTPPTSQKILQHLRKS